jgi:exodeoxyribonuclease V gamma subunit
VRLHLEAALERDAPGRAFLSGGVTCCALVPMRSIPFRVVCLLGLNDAVFPRGQRPPSFDLIAQRPQPGDRSARDDDRYLFLEALLAARDNVILTYVGQNVRDNADLPPSVVVSELLDTLEEMATLTPTDLPLSPSLVRRVNSAHLPPPCEGGGRGEVSVRDRLVVRHPLQPFSPRCFGADVDSHAVSYARPYFDGAQALRGTRREAPTFVTAPLSVGSTDRVVTVDELIRFFRQPVRAFVETRLGLRLDTETDELADREPLELDNLESWQIGDLLLGQAVDGADLGSAETLVRAAGYLPAGALGRDAFEAVRPDVEAIATRWRALAGPAALAPMVVDLLIDGTRVTGVLRHVYPAGLIQAQFSRVGGRQEFALWVQHVVLNACAAGRGPCESYLVGRGAETGADVIRFRALDAPEDVLRALLRLYWLGQTLPLPLFQKTSRLYADAVGKGKSADEALDKARQEFDRRPQRGQPGGESDDVHVRQVYGDCGPLDPTFRPVVSDGATDFGAVAVAVFGPLLAHREAVA